MDDSTIFLSTLEQFLAAHRIEKAYFAHNAISPPLLAYVVNFPRLSIPLTGCYEMEIERRNRLDLIRPCPGQAIFIPPNCWNKPTWNEPVELMSFLFGKRQTGISLVSCGNSGENDLHARKMAIYRPVSGPSQKILQTIIDLYRVDQNYAAFPQLIESLLHCFCRLIRENKPLAQHKSQNLLQDICAYLQQNFQYEITRQQVARQFKISPNHLSRLFRTEGSMKFSDYLTFVRIDRAKFMLSKYDLTLNAIAQRCGYADLAYFCRVFKKITRKTPSQYRQAIRNVPLDKE